MEVAKQLALSCNFCSMQRVDKVLSEAEAKQGRALVWAVALALTESAESADVESVNAESVESAKSEQKAAKKAAKKSTKKAAKK